MLSQLVSFYIHIYLFIFLKKLNKQLFFLNFMHYLHNQIAIEELSVCQLEVDISLRGISPLVSATMLNTS
ncbi:hypothetical protein BpHYR1_011413 [Brachionus plicatilis]|uniref:Uncharacterized protein n=1 Tax=Brachionus plicatilis TaxID=10195 RepID=A0A3M7PMX8_BRAPC|nr:hypothetical protein BpHYR1_011413 [Brachionus plicatilis]